MVVISSYLPEIMSISDRILVARKGRIVEEGPAEAVLGAPKHPYTQALISAIPEIDPMKRKARMLLPGDPPNPENMPSGCAFHPRCPLATERCRREREVRGSRATTWSTLR